VATLLNGGSEVISVLVMTFIMVAGFAWLFHIHYNYLSEFATWGTTIVSLFSITMGTINVDRFFREGSFGRAYLQQAQVRYSLPFPNVKLWDTRVRACYLSIRLIMVNRTMIACGVSRFLPMTLFLLFARPHLPYLIRTASLSNIHRRSHAPHPSLVATPPTTNTQLLCAMFTFIIVFVLLNLFLAVVLNHYADEMDDPTSHEFWNYRTIRRLRRQFTSKFKILGLVKHKKNFYGAPIPVEITDMGETVLDIAHNLHSMNDKMDDELHTIDQLLHSVNELQKKIGTLEAEERERERDGERERDTEREREAERHDSAVFSQSKRII
jgi:hypothetical protein